MPRYAQLVMGPAGSGKSTYCSALVKHCESLRRTVHVINLDPAAENFDYPIQADIRELVSLDDVMEDETLRFGPNGGLVFCMEFLAQNMEWLSEQLGEDEDDYYLFDCPGQIELYTHVPVMKQLVDQLQHWNFAVCGVFLIDAQFMIEASKFVSGVMCALSAMVQLEIPHVNILSKLDLLSKKARKELERYLDPNLETLLAEELHEGAITNKYKKLNAAIASVIDNYGLVRFLPLDITEEDSINDVLFQIDSSIQYGEDMEPREMRDEVVDDDDDDEEDGGFFD